MKKIFAIEVGQWEGIFYPTWYADIYPDSEESSVREKFFSVNALTRRGAIRRAIRAINKIYRGSDTIIVIYEYDMKNFELKEIRDCDN